MARSFEDRIKMLKKLLDIQKSEGNWNYDEYQFGFANGMILALSVIEDTSECEYLDAPELFKRDLELLDKLNNSSIIVGKGGSDESITSSNSDTGNAVS